MLQEPSKLISTFCHFLAPIYGIFSAKIGENMCFFVVKNDRKKFFSDFFKYTISDVFLTKKSIPGVKISLKCKTSLFSANFSFCTISKKQKVMKTRKFHILDYFWHRESTFWAKIRRKWSIWNFSRKTFLTISDKKPHIFTYFCRKYAINRHPKVVESPNFFWRSSKHLFKSCKKIKSLLASGHEWQRFKKVHSLFWDTLYLIL